MKVWPMRSCFQTERGKIILSRAHQLKNMIGHHLAVLKNLFFTYLEIFPLKENIQYRVFHCRSNSTFLDCPVEEKFCEHTKSSFMSREVRFCVSSVAQIIIGEILGMVFVEGKTLGNPPPKHQLCQQGLSEPYVLHHFRINLRVYTFRVL